MEKTISQSMVIIASSLNAKFYLNDRFMSFDEVFSEIGFLPAITKRADQLCSLCLGYGLGATYDEAEGAILGLRVVFDESNLLLLMINDEFLSLKASDLLVLIERAL